MDLQVFLTVAKAGSMGRAAEALHTVQSNVTTRVQALERELGAVLFRRHSRGVTLTEAGQRLLPFAEQISQLTVAARQAVADDGTPAGTLGIGSLETTAALRLPPVLAAFAGANPAVDLTLVTETSEWLVSEVLARRLEGAFVAGPVRHRDLAEEVVFEEELVLITPLTMRTIEALGRQRALKMVVFRAGCAYRHRLEAWLARRGLVGVRRLDSGTVDGIVGCVAAGIGISLLPRAVVAGAVAAGRVAAHALPAGEGRVDTVFIRRQDGHVSSALAAFLAAVRGAAMLRLRAAE